MVDRELLDAYGREVKVGDYVELDSVVWMDYGVVTEIVSVTEPNNYAWTYAVIDSGGKHSQTRACYEVAVLASKGESLGLGMLPFG